jgi:DNA repair protein RadC
MAKTKIQMKKMPKMAEINVSYKSKIDFRKQPVIANPEEANKAFRTVWDSKKLELREDVVILVLNTARRLIGWVRIFSGGMNKAIVDAKLIFQVGLNANAASLLIAHNHPSGDLKPSSDDLRLTKKLVDGGRLLDIEIDDHFIITKSDYFSIRENNSRLWKQARYQAYSP